MNQNKAGLWADLWLDMRLILDYLNLPVTLKNKLWLTLACDGFIILILFRIRQWCRRHRVLGINRIFRMIETAMFSIELGNEIELGHGVYFMHTLGVVVGGNARIGDACIFLGSNTIGASGETACPRIGARTVIGAGARVLGDIDIGDDCVLGANAVVVDDVPSGKVAMGVPARIKGDNTQLRRIELQA